MPRASHQRVRSCWSSSAPPNVAVTSPKTRRFRDCAAGHDFLNATNWGTSTGFTTYVHTPNDNLHLNILEPISEIWRCGSVAGSWEGLSLLCFVGTRRVQSACWRRGIEERRKEHKRKTQRMNEGTCQDSSVFTSKRRLGTSPGSPTWKA